MPPQLTTTRVTEQFLDLLGDEESRKGLLACAAAVTLDDETARRAVALVAGSNGSTGAVVDRIKDMGCVWHQADGTWFVAEDLQPHLLDRLYDEVVPDVRDRLHALLAEQTERRIGELPVDGQLTAYRTRVARIEAAFQRMLTRDQVADGGRAFAEVWQEAKGDAKEATARAAEALAPDLERQLRRLPDEVLFLRGMAARERRDRAAQRRYFEQVWRGGKKRGRRPGEIYAIAAHLFGNLSHHERRTAEEALRDSLAWKDDPFHQGQVYHSLGNLLAKERRRWGEAEDAYKKSLELLRDASDQGQVYHSLGNLLAKERRRWGEAEDAYKKSLELRRDASHQGQVYHSLGNLLAKDHGRWEEAKAAFEKSLDLRQDREHQASVLASWADALIRRLTTKGKNGPEAAEAERHALESRRLTKRLYTRSIASRVLATLYERQGQIRKAIEAYEDLLDTDRKQHKHQFARKTQEKIDELRRRL